MMKTAAKKLFNTFKDITLCTKNFHMLNDVAGKKFFWVLNNHDASAAKHFNFAINTFKK